jgi:hypothetical protein
MENSFCLKETINLKASLIIDLCFGSLVERSFFYVSEKSIFEAVILEKKYEFDLK